MKSKRVGRAIGALIFSVIRRRDVRWKKNVAKFKEGVAFSGIAKRCLLLGKANISFQARRVCLWTRSGRTEQTQRSSTCRLSRASPSQAFPFFPKSVTMGVKKRRSVGREMEFGLFHEFQKSQDTSEAEAFSQSWFIRKNLELNRRIHFGSS
jgi:hypothetical protein